MHDIYKLKEMLCEELEEYGRKGEMTPGTLEVVDKLAHAVKNLDKIIETADEEYSGDDMSYRGSYRGRSYRGGSYGGSYDGGSYARGRNARRDSMGRYSRAASDLVNQLRQMMPEVDEETRRDIERLVNRMEK